MEEKRQPDFKGDGVAVWVNKNAKTGEKMLNIRLLYGSISCYAYLNKPKEKKEELGGL